MKDLLRPGDFFRISTRRMAASGEVVKVNRTTFDWRSDFMGHPVSGKIALHELRHATIRRGEVFFSLL